MIKNYFRLKYHIFFYAFLYFFCFVLGFVFYSFILFLIYLSLVTLFRQRRVFFRDTGQFKMGGVFTPVNGKVKNIEHGVSHPLFGDSLVALEMIISPIDEYGLYLPVSGELVDFYVSGKSMFEVVEPLARESSKIDKGLAFTVKTKDDDPISLQFPKSIFGIFPKIKLMPGDRGLVQANFGHFPLGGKVLLYLPEKYEILVSKGDRLRAGESLIAGSPELK